ncbi:MarR family winged helix-turn-helix transcriptional regulator [Cellulomonas sp. ICMP 17802]|uniref:MarR family winged helix-turn-helix transcriptional regulator n=1 Tax=Cellulomonas sp. ICMP 17802 TaxID=3239199 RepID=UPI00351BDC5A
MDQSAAEAARELRVVFGRLRRRLREVAGVSVLTPSQASVLSRLDKDGPATASGLATAEGVRPQSVAATLAALEERGLIRRDADPADGRRQVVSLSDDGRARLAGDRQARQEWLAQAMQDRYSSAERQTILDALVLLDRLTHP